MPDVRELAARVPRPVWMVTAAVALVAVGAAGALAIAGGDDAPAAVATQAPFPTASAHAPGPVTTTATSDSLGEACEATVTLTTWAGGYRADVDVTAGVALTGWSVGIDVGASVVDGSWGVDLPLRSTGLLTLAPLHGRGMEEEETVRVGFSASGIAPEPLTVWCDGVAAAEDDDAAEDSGDVASARGAAEGDWLRTDGNRIVDLAGNQVWLTGANWFGFNTSERVIHGLWTADMTAVLDQVATRGFNVLRVPISTELLLEWKAGDAEISGSVNQAGPQAGLTTLEVFDAFLAGCRERGVKVILDVHSARADNMGHVAPVWWDGDIGAEDFVEGWEWVAERYRDDDTILAFDLQNEPHGKADESPRAKWDGSADADNWRHVAQDLALRILDIHPDVLVLVEGTEIYPRDGRSWASTDRGAFHSTWWGGNLRGAAEFPIDLGAYQDRLVYSPHEYGPLVFEQDWFTGTFSRASLERDVWDPNWLYLHKDGTAPVLIGEWGGRLGQDARQDRWMEAVRDLIVDERLAHTFWCVNPNSGDTGGLLLDDWATWDETKYALVEPALWQDANGWFVSLDHETPLPGGITVTQFYEEGGSL